MSLINFQKSISSTNSINIVNSNPQFANLNLLYLNANLLKTSIFPKFISLDLQSYNMNLSNIKLFSKFFNFANLKSATTRIKLYIYIYISVYSL